MWIQNTVNVNQFKQNIFNFGSYFYIKKIQIPLKNISIKNIETVKQPAIIVNNVNMYNKHIVLITLICLWWLTLCKNIFWKPESHRGSCTNVFPFILLILIQSTDVRCDSIQDMIQDSQSKHCRTLMSKVQTLHNNVKKCVITAKQKLEIKWLQ